MQEGCGRGEAVPTRASLGCRIPTPAPMWDETVVAAARGGHGKREDAANKAPGAAWGMLNRREGGERLSDSSKST